MNADIADLEVGIFLLLVGIFIFSMRNRMNKIPPGKEKFYFKTEQIKNKRFMLGISFIIIGGLVITNYLLKLFNWN